MSEAGPDASPDAPARPIGARRRIVAVCVGVVAGLVLGEIAARVWVAVRWSDELLAAHVDVADAIGRYEARAHLPYALRRDFVGKDTRHDALGFRGDGLPPDRAPDSHLVVCIGGSTTYGIYLQPEGSYPARLGAELRRAGVDAHVLNAGVPGWVSTELAVDLRLRVLPLEPSAVVVYAGRNEVFPQCYRGFREDYSHYRNREYSPRAANRMHKRLFRFSYLFMLTCTRGSDRFGWDSIDNNPSYGCIVRGNMPTAPEIVENLRDTSRESTYRASLRTIAEACRERNVEVVFATMAFLPDRLATAIVRRDPTIIEPFRQRVERNNELMREVAAESGAVLVETARLVEHPEFFLDDCHVTAEGAQARAEMIAAVLAPLLLKR